MTDFIHKKAKLPTKLVQIQIHTYTYMGWSVCTSSKVLSIWGEGHCLLCRQGKLCKTMKLCVLLLLSMYIYSIVKIMCKV